MKWLRAFFSWLGRDKRKAAAAGAGSAVILGLTITATQTFGPGVNPYPGTTTISFPSCPATSLTRAGTQSLALVSDNNAGTWELSGATWSAPGLYPYPVRSDVWTQGCLRGGRLEGPISQSLTRDQWYNNVGGLSQSDSELRITQANLAGNWAYIKDTYAENMEDFIDPNAEVGQSTYVDHVRSSWIRDDCFEVEQNSSATSGQSHNLYVNNSYLECFTGLAERPTGSVSQNTGTAPSELVIENSLFYMRPQPLGSNYCSATHVTRGRCLDNGDGTWMGSHGLWKWSSWASGTVAIRNTIIRIDITSYTSCRAQEWPPGTYENVTIVWAGDALHGLGPYGTAGDCTNVVPDGVTVTEDLSVWDAAVSHWLTQ